MLTYIYVYVIVGACDQTWSSGERHENQVPGGDLSVFSANQGIEVGMKTDHYICIIVYMLVFC